MYHNYYFVCYKINISSRVDSSNTWLKRGSPDGYFLINNYVKSMVFNCENNVCVIKILM